MQPRKQQLDGKHYKTTRQPARQRSRYWSRNTEGYMIAWQQPARPKENCSIFSLISS